MAGGSDACCGKNSTKGNRRNTIYSIVLIGGEKNHLVEKMKEIGNLLPAHMRVVQLGEQHTYRKGRLTLV